MTDEIQNNTQNINGNGNEKLEKPAKESAEELINTQTDSTSKNNTTQDTQDLNSLLKQIEELKLKLSECEKQRDEYLAGWQRARADFSNYKKDESLRFQEFANYANESLIRDLIPVLDSFDLGISALEKVGNVDKGIYMIRTKLEDVLRDYGLQRIKIEIGKPIDLNVAEAILEVETDGEPGIVLEEIEAGYKLKDKVIRPARVKVSKQKS